MESTKLRCTCSREAGTIERPNAALSQIKIRSDLDQDGDVSLTTWHATVGAWQHQALRMNMQS